MPVLNFDFSFKVENIVVTPQQLGIRESSTAKNRAMHFASPLTLAVPELFAKLKETYPLCLVHKVLGPMNGNWPYVNKILRLNFNKLLIVPMKLNEHNVPIPELGYRFLTERSRNIRALHTGCITIDLTAPSVLIGYQQEH